MYEKWKDARKIKAPRRQDANYLPLGRFLQHFEECEAWPTHLTEKDSTFKRMLEIDEVFVIENNTKGYNQSAQNDSLSEELTPGIMKSNEY